MGYFRRPPPPPHLEIYDSHISPLHIQQFVEPTGKRYLLAIDVSGSMTGCKVLGANTIDARTASAAMAMVTARTESKYHMVGFSDKLVPLSINSSMDLSTVISTIGAVSANEVGVSVVMWSKIIWA